MILRQIGPALLAVLLGGMLAILGSRWLIAEWNGEMAQTSLNNWAEQGGQPAPAAVASAEAQAIQSIRFHPGRSGEHWDRLGRIYAWANWDASITLVDTPPALIAPARLLAEPIGRDGAQSAERTRLRALSAYDQAVSLRPLWPYGQLRLASARLNSGLPDARFNALLREGFELGPWRRSVNREVARLGLIAWDYLEPATRFVVLEACRRTAGFGRGDVAWLRTLADQTGRRALIDGLILAR